MAYIGLEPSTQWSNGVLGGGVEAQYCQDIARRLKPILEAAGHRCDVFAGAQDANSDGARALAYAGCDLALSIHSDAGYDGNSHWAALCCKQEERSRRWWTAVMECYCSSMRFEFQGQRITHYGNRGYQQRTPGTNGVAVIRIPESVGIPTALIEVNWHDRSPDAAAERMADWRQLCAESLARGVLTYLGQAMPLPPMKRKGEEVMYCPPEISREGDYKVIDFPDVFNSLPMFEAVYPGLTLHNRNPNPIEVFVWVTRDTGTISLVNGGTPETAGATFRVTVPGWSAQGGPGRVWVELAQFIGRNGYIGGASLTVKARADRWFASCASIAKWK